jgi:hypothetical protein
MTGTLHVRRNPNAHDLENETEKFGSGWWLEEGGLSDSHHLIWNNNVAFRHVRATLYKVFLYSSQTVNLVIPNKGWTPGPLAEREFPMYTHMG